MKTERRETYKEGGLTMKNRVLHVVLGLFVVGSLFVSINSHAIVVPIVREIAEEVFEFLVKKGGKELAESVGKKVGKEAMEELAERTIKEVGEEGAKKLFRELGEQALKHGDDAFLVAKRYGVSQTVNLLKELPEETGKTAMKSLLNRGDDLMPLIQKFGSEVLEVEAKHPGLSPRIVSEFGEEGLKVMKNYRTDQVQKILRSEILSGLTTEGKKELCRKLGDPGIATQIIDFFEKHPNTTNALVKLSAILGGTYIVSEKLLSSDIKKQLPDGRVVTDEVSVLQNRTVKQNPDGSVEEETKGVIGSFGEGIKKLVAEGAGFYFTLIIGTAIGLFFVIRGVAPMLVKGGK